MTFVFSQSAGAYNYIESITDDHRGNILQIPSIKNMNRTESKPYIYRTRTEHEHDFFKVL